MKKAIWATGCAVLFQACGNSATNDPPTLLSVVAIDYTHADLTFSEAVTPDSAAELANYAIAPQKPAGLAITQAAVQSSTVVRLTFAQPLLPRLYTLTVNNVKDTSGKALNAGSAIDLTGNGKVAFVTTGTGPGNLALWSDSGGVAGLAGADAICAAEADRAGLVGTFEAWLSDSGTDALVRIGSTSGPWIRTDGFPLTDSISSFINDNDVLVPLSYDAAGAHFTPDIDTPGSQVWTFTNAAGARLASSNQCANWTSDDVALEGTAGFLQGTTQLWTANAPAACNLNGRLYCFQTGEGPAVPAYQTTGKRVFVTSTAGAGSLAAWPGSQAATGILGGDNICKARAAAAGLANPTMFKAWLSDASTNAIDHLTSDGPWVLANGVQVAGNKSELVSGNLFTSIILDEFGAQSAQPALLDIFAWTGTDAAGRNSTYNCSNWNTTLSTASGDVGTLVAADASWSQFIPFRQACNGHAHLYCFEDQ